MNRIPLYADRVFNRPFAITPAKAEIIAAVQARRFAFDEMSVNGVRRPVAFYLDDDADASVREPRRDKGYDLVGGAAVIAIEGTLVQKSGDLRPYSGMTGYDGIRQAFLTAMIDPAVKGVVLDIDSPGGEVSGCFDLADTIFAARGQKPIVAILGEMACSAAYALASAADTVTVPRTGIAGSIGVVLMHVDWSKALAGAGIAVTFIQYGARKTDGASEKPLDPEALARIQSDIDTIGDLFVATVARNRNRSAAAIRGQEAGIFQGENAIAAGLADAVMAPDAAFQRFIQSLPA